MSQEPELSQADDQNLGQHKREQLLEDEKTPDLVRAKLLLQQGQELAEKEEFEAAIVSYDQALQIDPDNYEVWSSRGVALYSLGRYEEAIASCNKQALQITEDSHIAWKKRGYELFKLEQYEEAIASYDQALRLKPDDHITWFYRGYALDELGRYEEAIASYDQTLQIKSDDHIAWNNRGIILRNLERYEEAIASFDQVLHLKPDDPLAWRQRGYILAKLERYEEAVFSYDQALDQASKIALKNQFKLYCNYGKITAIKVSGKLLPYLANRWARGKRTFWQRLYLICFAFPFLTIFGTTLLIILLFQGTLVAEILKGLLSVLFTSLAILLISFTLITFKKNIKLPYKIYFRSGILSYVRAVLIGIITIVFGALIYTYSPSFLRLGWGQLVFSGSGNWAVTQPFEMANQAAQTANSIQDQLAAQIPESIPEIPSQSQPKPSQLDFKWIFIPTIWLLFMIVLPYWAEFEEKEYRQGVHTWKGITINSIKFGLVHLIMGIPICWGLSLSVPGFLLACRYKYVYHRHLKKFGDQQKAQEAGVFASTADHAIYNAMLITLLTLAILLA